MARRQIPVIALTGYLGAGKTTVLNHLLRTPGARIGVVVNDFGTINVDAGLITGQVDAAQSIAGGCVCCLDDSGGLDEALARLAAPRLRLDVIIIEASGVAEPLSLARLIRFSQAKNIRPAGLIEVVDAANYFETVDTHADPPARFEAASLVVLNKLDQLGQEAHPGAGQADVLERITERIALRNPRVPLVHAVRGAIDPELVFDVALAEDPEDQLPLGALMRAEHGSHTHQHAASVSVTAGAPIAAGALLDLLERPPSGVYRLKGIVQVATARGAKSWAVNLVGRHIHVAAHPSSDAAGLVAIGVGIDEHLVRGALAQTLRPAQGPDAEGMRRLQRHARLSA
ncbi:cobalamin biosynthesis protein CobW [Arthrobacter sp. MYb229]|uniref:CobW family GTP-binding protein n=1 Tax=unclassified Arthrobacter TaxID=235627 RepID=UPI000CFD8C2C|nr:MULTISPECIES: GTP-binding protein [unclassified Arthrobacter]PRA00008.1 cobalamin biosynthesis protein CobW [Arthrobacter sp. MYb229]PRB48318.1 cobalamin biosynthesis protein CobW [Arthrobacter sp. MYb216]